MKIAINCLLTVIVSIFFSHFAEAIEFYKPNKPHPSNLQYKGLAGFPKYSTPKAAHIPNRHDSLGNRVTDDHLKRVDFAHNRSEIVMKPNPHVTDVVRFNRARFTNFYRPTFEQHRVVFNNYISRYNTVIVSHPVFVDLWHRHGFFGGFYWGFHPIIDIDTYFYNPMVQWFYVGSFDADYYRNWYRTEYDAYPQLQKPFEYHGLYYPTENMKQLLFGVSAMPTEKQAIFRDAVSVFTRKTAQTLANGLSTHVKLKDGDIAVTHYEVVGQDEAIVLEGVVSYNDQPYNFKGLLDLKNPEATDVFVPATWDKNPNSEQLAKLDGLNSRIDSIKGVPSQEVTAEPEPAMAAPSPAEVSADPQ